MRMSEQLKSTGSLLNATEAVGNWRAVLLYASTLIGSALIFGLFAMMHSSFAIGLGGLLALATLFYGSNAVGIMLMDASRNGVSRPPLEAVMASLLSSHRLLGVALVAAVGLLLLLLAVAILFLICKIPGVGPLLFTFIMPLTTLLLGLTFFALAYVFFPLAASAVWHGASVLQVVSNLLAVVRQRLLAVMLQEIVLMLIIGVTSFIISGVLLFGLSMTGGMAAGILGIGHTGGMGGMGGGMMTSLLMMVNGMGEGNGYLLAGMIGTSLLLAVAFILPGLIGLQGFCQTYLSAIEGLNLEASDALVKQRVEQARRKMDEARQRMEERVAQRSAPATAGAPAEAAAEVAAPVCPACHAPAEADDVFCGHCGHKMR